ncbi:AfsA-related hotdog domain-containing protein [Streptomyces rubiginosohelvolus]|uniref:AfsA-related hotdog domain-containing protein n=1 Tax=Streptomyces rubiginosohelvolus TaxID=67362 RepID=UPI003663350D
MCRRCEKRVILFLSSCSFAVSGADGCTWGQSCRRGGPPVRLHWWMCPRTGAPASNVTAGGEMPLTFPPGPFVGDVYARCGLGRPGAYARKSHGLRNASEARRTAASGISPDWRQLGLESMASMLVLSLDRLGSDYFEAGCQWPRLHPLNERVIAVRHHPMLMVESTRQLALALQGSHLPITGNGPLEAVSVRIGLRLPRTSPWPCRWATSRGTVGASQPSASQLNSDTPEFRSERAASGLPVQGPRQ